MRFSIDAIPYLPTVPIWSGQSQYYYLNPTSRPLALESLVCPDMIGIQLWASGFGRTQYCTTFICNFNYAQ